MKEEYKEKLIQEVLENRASDMIAEDTNFWPQISARLPNKGRSFVARWVPATLSGRIAAGFSMFLILALLSFGGIQVKGWLNWGSNPEPFSETVVGWSKTFGSEQLERGYSVQQTSDGGYIIVGEVQSFDPSNGVIESNAECPVLVIKTDSEGNLEWEKTLGNTEFTRECSVLQTDDGGYILAGLKKYLTPDYSAGTSGSGSDAWLCKIDSEGNPEWEKTFGRSEWDGGKSVWQTSDGGYIIVGNTFSNVDGSVDVWLIKADFSGNKLWDKTFGGEDYDDAYSVQQTSDGGYIFAGMKGNIMEDNTDAWLVKTDSQGNLEWEKTFGGPGWDGAKSVQETPDGGYIASGYMSQEDDLGGEKLTWLIKTDSEGNLKWEKTFEYALWGGQSVQPTSDEGYIVAGDTLTSIVFIKIDSEGNRLWERSFNKDPGAECTSFLPVSDGGYIIVGDKKQPYWKYEDLWFIKLGTTNPPGQPYCFVYNGGDDGSDTRDWGDYVIGHLPDNVDSPPTLWSAGGVDPDPDDIHAASQWQISEVEGDYSSPVFDSGIDRVNLTEIIIPPNILNDSTTYFCRVRYQDNQGFWSDYSEEVSFTTADIAGY